jgi:hypothetical protein
MIEEVSSSEMSVRTTDTRRDIPEDAILHSHRRENLKSYIFSDIFFPLTFLFRFLGKYFLPISHLVKKTFLSRSCHGFLSSLFILMPFPAFLIYGCLSSGSLKEILIPAILIILVSDSISSLGETR